MRPLSARARLELNRFGQVSESRHACTSIAECVGAHLKLVRMRVDAPHVVARYRVLFCVPGFTRLLVSSVLGRMPMGMFSLAILLFVHEKTGSFLAAGLTF